MRKQISGEVEVPPAFGDGAQELAKRWCEEVGEAVECFDDVYDFRIDEVENEHRDGFIPFTNGGYDGIGTATLSAAHSSGSAPAIIRPYLDREVKDIEEAWDAENPEHPISWIYSDEDDAQLNLLGPSTEREHWREQWYEFQDAAMSEGGTYFYKVRVLFYGEDNHRNETGEPEAYFMVGVNTDFEYGRDNIPWLSCYGSDPQQTKWVWEKNVPLSQLTTDLVDAMIVEAGNALASKALRVRVCSVTNPCARDRAPGR